MSEIPNWKLEMWSSIDSYTVACGGDPGDRVYGATKRQLAVVDVEQAVEGELARMASQLTAAKQRAEEAEKERDEARRQRADVWADRKRIKHQLTETRRKLEEAEKVCARVLAILESDVCEYDDERTAEKLLRSVTEKGG